MENTLRMPNSYYVMNEEEMTYTDGGSVVGTVISAGISIGFLINYASCISGARNWYAAHKTNNVGTDLNNGINALSAYISSSTVNAIKGVCATVTGIGLWPISLILLVTA